MKGGRNGAKEKGSTEPHPLPLIHWDQVGVF